MALLSDTALLTFLLLFPFFFVFFCFSFPWNRAWLTSSNKAVVVMRDILIGKTKPMYVAMWRFFFHNAALQGLDPPARQVTGPGPATADPPLAPADEGRTAKIVDLPNSAVYPSGPAPTGHPLRKRVPLVALVLDFETAEHDGAFEAMAIEVGGAPSDYYG